MTNANKKYFKTPDGRELLCDWGYDTEYEKNEKRAKEGARRLLAFHRPKFLHGDRPRTVAEFFDCLPYTSTSDFAAVWANCNFEIEIDGRRGETLGGIALTEKEIIAVLTCHDEAGNETGTRYITL